MAGRHATLIYGHAHGWGTLTADTQETVTADSRCPQAEGSHRFKGFGTLEPVI
jgi:hypothetical protein